MSIRYDYDPNQYDSNLIFWFNLPIYFEKYFGDFVMFLVLFNFVISNIHLYLGS